MSSSISKRFSLPLMSLEKHPLKLMRRSGAANRSFQGDVVRNTLDKSVVRNTLDTSLPNVRQNKIHSSSPKIVSRSVDKLEEIINSSKIMKIAHKVSKTIFPNNKYYVQREEEKYDRSIINESFLDSSESSSPGSSHDFISSCHEVSSLLQEDSSFSLNSLTFDEESTMSIQSCESSLFEFEEYLETKNDECQKIVNESVQELGTKINNLITNGIATIKRDLGTKYNLIIQLKQQENILMLEDIHEKFAESLQTIQNEIKTALREKEESTMNVMGNFRARIEDSRVHSKRMAKSYEKMLKAAENKIQDQREEILRLKLSGPAIVGRDDILD